MNLIDVLIMIYRVKEPIKKI